MPEPTPTPSPAPRPTPTPTPATRPTWVVSAKDSDGNVMHVRESTITHVKFSAKTHDHTVYAGDPKTSTGVTLDKGEWEKIK